MRFDIREVCAGGSPKCRGFKSKVAVHCIYCSNALIAATRKPRVIDRTKPRWSFYAGWKG